jgi:dihydroorotase
MAFSDAAPLSDPAVMRNALSYAAMLDVPIMCHCEDPRLNKGWAMHEGAVAMRLGLPGYPAIAEEIVIARDIALAEQVGARIHICHVSTAGGVAQIRAAKERGVRITADVTPHHLTLDERWVLGWLAPPPAEEAAPKRGGRGRAAKAAETGLDLPTWLNSTRLAPFDSSTRLNPPLRTEEDCEALIEGLRDGTLDAISSDHSPQSLVEKECEYRWAAPGISGLETALGLTLTLVHRGKLDLVDLVARFTEGPSRLLERQPSTLRPGAWADIVIFDPDYVWSVEPAQFASRGKHTPLAGQKLKGNVMLTMHHGKIVFRRGNFGASTGALQQPARLEGILDIESEE